MQASLDNLVNLCLDKINKKEYEEDGIEENIKSFIKFMESAEINVKGRYTHKIIDIKNANKKAKIREPEQTKS